MISFGQPLYLFLLLLILPLIYLNHFFSKRGGVFKFPLTLYNEEKKVKFASKRYLILYIFSYSLLYLSLVFIIFGFSEPLISIKKVNYLSKGANIIVVLDSSPSMGAVEFYPLNRFEFSKTLIKNFIKQRENDSIGLVAFGETASLVVPLTENRDFFISSLDDIHIMDFGNGSSLSIALSIAMRHLDLVEAEKKTILVLTDGVIRGRELYKNQVISLARSMGIKIYTIGIGSDAEFNVDFKTRDGKHYQGKLKEVYDESLLREFASKTEGEFYLIDDETSFQIAMEEFSRKEEIERKSNIVVKNESIYERVLYIAFFLLFLFYFFVSFVLKEVL